MALGEALGDAAEHARCGAAAWPSGQDQAAGDRIPRGIADHIRSMILQGDLKTGDRLPSQRDLAARFGASRPSVREAISALESMGLVLVRLGSGVYVAPPDGRAQPWRFSDRCTPRDVYEARLGLETYAVRLAAARMGDDQAPDLAAAVEALAAALDRRDIPAMAAADARFHDLIFALAANPVLAGMYGPVRDMMEESQRLPMLRRDRLDETLAEHRAIAARLAARDPEGAARAMRDHIGAAARRYGIAIDGPPQSLSGSR